MQVSIALVFFLGAIEVGSGGQHLEPQALPIKAREYLTRFDSIAFLDKQFNNLTGDACRYGCIRIR